MWIDHHDGREGPSRAYEAPDHARPITASAPYGGATVGQAINRRAYTMEMAVEVIGLMSGMAGLIAAIISLKQSRENASSLTRHKIDIQKLESEVNRVALGLTIDIPCQGDIISGDAYNDMKGKFTGDIPPGYRLWVLARDQFNYFLMYPPTQSIATQGLWSQTNVRLATPGRWELHVCLADEKASRSFEDKAKRNDWAGFSNLPEGVAVVRQIVVEKRQ